MAINIVVWIIFMMTGRLAKITAKFRSYSGNLYNQNFSLFGK